MLLIFETTIPVDQETLFDFHACPRCIEVLHADWSKLRVLKAEDRLRVGAETWVEHTVGRVLPVVLGFRHFTVEPPFRFGEELIHGPFAKFRHLHEFEKRGGKTLLRDTVEVELPWQFGGQAAMKFGVAGAIRRMFRARGEALLRLAENGTVRELAERNRGLC